MAVFGQLNVPIELDSDALDCVGIDAPFGEDLVATGHHVGVMLDVVSGWAAADKLLAAGTSSCHWRASRMPMTPIRMSDSPTANSVTCEAVEKAARMAALRWNVLLSAKADTPSSVAETPWPIPQRAPTRPALNQRCPQQRGSSAAK